MNDKNINSNSENNNFDDNELFSYDTSGNLSGNSDSSFDLNSFSSQSNQGNQNHELSSRETLLAIFLI